MLGLAGNLVPVIGAVVLDVPASDLLPSVVGGRGKMRSNSITLSIMTVVDN